jgi:hypothetical protein
MKLFLINNSLYQIHDGGNIRLVTGLEEKELLYKLHAKAVEIYAETCSKESSDVEQLKVYEV